LPEDIALFIDFENIRYSMLNIQRREPDPQELIAVARRYGTVMVARAYADWSRQPEPFKGSLTAAMIDRVDCPAKQRDRIRMGTIHYPSSNSPTGPLPTPSYVSEQGSGTYPPGTSRQWSTTVSSNSGSLPALQPTGSNDGWMVESDEAQPLQNELDTQLLQSEEATADENYGIADCQRDPYRQNYPYTPPASNPCTSPLSYPPTQHTGNTGHLPAISTGSSSTIVQSTVVQSTVDLNMLMDIIETVFDRPTISTFVLMTGDKDFTRISARLKLRLNKTVIVVGIPGTVSRDLISSANQFVPLVPGGTGNTGALPAINGNAIQQMSPSTGNTGALPAFNPMSYTGPMSEFKPILCSPRRYHQWTCSTHSSCSSLIILIATGLGAPLLASLISLATQSIPRIVFVVGSPVSLHVNC
jgi:uncharacterized LabA/DUF88 family protein